MRITNIKIQNYRGIEHCNFQCSKFTCIIGENNAGKSTILSALNIFLSGAKLSNSDFYDIEKNVEIELEMEEIEESDVLRLTNEHAEKIREVIYDKKLTLLRRYKKDESPAWLHKKLMPKDDRFNITDDELKGKRGKDLESYLSSKLPEFSERFTSVDSQKKARAICEEIIKDLPIEQFVLKETPLVTGIDNSIRALLPEPIFIAAVKDFKDEVKPKESNFAKLLVILISLIQDTPALTDIVNSFDGLYKLLNREYREDGSILDDRDSHLKNVESKMHLFLKEIFPNAKVELQIDKPELKQIFANSQILVDDGIKSSIETKGDGLKRALVFAILRTYIEISKEQKNQEKNIDSLGENIKPKPQPYLFLFEEPELYLHPSAQKILFEALERLSFEKNQVIVTTHSPTFLSPTATSKGIGTFVKVKKEYPANKKPLGKVITVNVEEMTLKNAFQMICYENNAVAFFAKKVLLVEGDCDLIYIKELAKKLDESWNFDYANIPIVKMNGKSNIKRYKEFFEKFEIEVFALFDSDFMIDGFDQIEVSEQIKIKRSSMIAEIDKIIESENLKIDISKDDVKSITSKRTWKERYNRLKELVKNLQDSKNLTNLSQNEIDELNNLFIEEEQIRRRIVFNDSTRSLLYKQDILSLLREVNIFILSHGTIESYYPEGINKSTDKPTQALEAVEKIKDVIDIKSILPKIKIGDTNNCEFDLIFSKIFS